MNKIVLEHYPVEKLPDDIKSKIDGVGMVTLTIEQSPLPKFTRNDLLALIGKPVGPSVNTLEGIRALRDEWD